MGQNRKVVNPLAIVDPNYIKMKTVNQIFIEALDYEIARIPGGELNDKIVDFCSKIHLTTKLNTLFTQRYLFDCVTVVFNSLDLRDFILSLTDNFMVNLLLSVEEGSCVISNGDSETATMSLFRSVSRSLHYGVTADNQYCLIPDPVANNLNPSYDDLLSILLNNKWLLSIIFINLNFTKTKTYEDKIRSVKQNTN